MLLGQRFDANISNHRAPYPFLRLHLTGLSERTIPVLTSFTEPPERKKGDRKDRSIIELLRKNLLKEADSRSLDQPTYDRNT